ncbi:unnamed protein product [Arctia plantaginis]|uniref:Major facilitator superfamily (MFS) profile domain-containing protein n=1 Tax=Arctia plantaginis TaxID=874455 RepID=A0A8S1A5C8_ARCPL|nr:unnamed protein product [Arctia plantaginis]
MKENGPTSDDMKIDKEAEGDFEDDYVVKSIGSIGRWQIIVCIIVASSRLIASWNMLAILFLTPTTEFKCIKFKDNYNETTDVQLSKCYENCEEYEYYQDVFESTLISQFGLICDRAWMASFTQTAMMLGLVCGISLFGWISDRFGRRNALILSTFTDVIFMMTAAFAPTYWTFTALRFFVGVASGGIMSITAVFTIEIVGPAHREMAGGLALLPDSISEILLAGFAYFAPTWNIYLLGFSGTSVVIATMLLFLPETPRWLVTTGKVDRAVELMTKAAKFNKRSVDGIRDTVNKSVEELNLKDNEAESLNYTDLFRTRKLTLITIFSFMIWFVTGVCYFGLNQYTTVLGANIFFVVPLLGCIQIPLAPLTSLITRVFGRRASAIGTYIIAGASMICLIFIPAGTWVSTMLGFIGVAAAFLNFCVLYIFVTELYPTPMRNMGFSISAAGSKFGATVAPFVATLKPQWIASTIFAILPIMAAVICFLLPETKGKKLSDTVEK